MPSLDIQLRDSFAYHLGEPEDHLWHTYPTLRIKIVIENAWTPLKNAKQNNCNNLMYCSAKHTLIKKLKHINMSTHFFFFTRWSNSKTLVFWPMSAFTCATFETFPSSFETKDVKRTSEEACSCLSCKVLKIVDPARLPPWFGLVF